MTEGLYRGDCLDWLRSRVNWRKERPQTQRVRPPHTSMGSRWIASMVSRSSVERSAMVGPFGVVMRKGRSGRLCWGCDEVRGPRRSGMDKAAE